MSQVSVTCSLTRQVMYFSSYGPFKFTLKSAQNATFSVNHTLRWNNSNLITDWETVLTLHNYMGGIQKLSQGFRCHAPIRTWLALKIAHLRTCSMFRILFLDQCYPLETEASKFSVASWKDFPYRSSKFRLSNLMSSH